MELNEQLKYPAALYSEEKYRNFNRPVIRNRCAANCYYKLYLNISRFTVLNILCVILIKNLKDLLRFVPFTCHYPPVLLKALHSIICKCKLINFSQYKLRVYLQDPHYMLWPRIIMYCLSVRQNFVPLLRFGVPWVKRKVAENWNRGVCGPEGLS
jgi:hypothetical protein